MRPLTTAVDPANLNASQHPAAPPLSNDSSLNPKEKKKKRKEKTWLVLKYFIHLVEVLMIHGH